MSELSEIKLETLTPIILDDDQKEKLNYKGYERTLDKVFVSEKFCNIALTGPYGAGKSSIMNTYESDHKDSLKTIHISLAKFNDADADNMQAKLINQIIHQIEPKRIPQTRFKVKKTVQGWKVALFSAMLFVFGLSMVYLFNVPKTQMLENSNISLFNMFWTHELNVVMLGLALASSLCLLIFIVNAQFKRPLIKAIQVDKSQIDLVEKDEETDNSKEKFDKYMDEIIYLFQQSQADALVIEDLDRFSDVKIFYELRQVNFLLNQKCSGKENKKQGCKKIKFIYMVRDELFRDSEERTKFFDVIVPIVPVIDNSNSYELMKNMLGSEWLDKLDNAYLKTICLNIRDYRVLKNIFNEFQVYYNQLQIGVRKYDPMKLFVMITYKNLWATDFADLQQGKGCVFEALKAIENLRKTKIAAIEEEILALQLKEAAMENELAEDVDELDAVYFSKCLYSSNDHAGYYVVDGINEYDFSSRKQFIRALKDAKSVTWRRGGYAAVSIETEKIEQAFASLEEIEEYVVRKLRLQEKLDTGIEGVEKEIAEKRLQIQHVEEIQFKQLTAEELPEAITNLFPEDKKLIQVFVQDEMIAADYPAYMTYFYPYSITEEERCYLNKVYARTNDEEQAQIMLLHPELVVEHLKQRDWSSVAFPNIALYKHFVKLGGANLTRAIENLKEHSNVEFAIMFLQELVETSGARVWINALFAVWENFIEELLKVNFWSHKQKIQIILQLLSDLKDDKVPSEDIREFFEMVEPELIEVCTYEDLKKLAKVSYEFEQIAQLPADMQNFVYENSMYQLSKENVEYVLEHFYIVLEQNRVYENNVSVIMEQKDSPLAKYVQENWEEYLFMVYLPHYAEHSKEKDVLLEILNNDEVYFEIRRLLVEKMSYIINDISEVSGLEIKNVIVEQNKMEFSNRNILAIWEQTEELSESLCNYLRERYKTGKCNLAFGFMKRYFKETQDEHPKAKLLVNELLGLKDFGESYKNLVEDIHIHYQGLAAINWNEEQMGYIVKTRTIDMTEKNLKLMRGYENKNLFYQWIISNIDMYLKLMIKAELRVNAELLHLIALPKVEDNEKIACIEACTEPVPITENYNTHVVEKVFERDLFDGNFEPVIRRYNQNRYGKRLAKSLGDYMISYISDTIRLKSSIPSELLMHVMESESVTNQNKKQLLAKQLPYYDFETVKKCLTLAGADAYLGVFEGHKPRVEATEANQVLIEALVKRGWISSYKAAEDEYILYPKKNIA